MPAESPAIRTYFAKLGLEPEIADIYLALHSYGPQTISALSRNARVERTRIYRLVDQLIESNLIEMDASSSRGILKAAPIANLRILINQRGQELQSLEDELQMVEQVLGRNQLSSPAVRVQSYHGSEGLKQIFTNQVNATGKVCGILSETIDIQADDSFYTGWATASNAKKLLFQGLISPGFHAANHTWSSNADRLLKHLEYRIIEPSVLPIRHSTIIYNDVVSHLNLKDGEVFGLELYNRDIADAQRQMFEILWEKSAPTGQV